MMSYQEELTQDDVELVHADDLPQDFRASANQAAYHIFLLINATLFLRPSEIIPALAGWPIYEVLNLACISLCLPQILNTLSKKRLAAAPIVACVLGLQCTIVLSDVFSFHLDRALGNAIDYAKVVAYFLMLVTVVDTPARLRNFLFGLLCFTTILTSLALLHFHGFVNIPAMAAAKEMWGDGDGETGELLRLCAAGIYGNPNDLARILIVGMFLAVYFVMEKGASPFRFLWIGPFLVMAYALNLTHSRGGLLALMAGLALLFKMRFGWTKFLIATFVAAPVVLVAFSGRQMEMSTSSGTGQQRIRLWAEGISYLRSSPLFGIGMNRYQEYMGLAAHNSFVQCFVDIGFIGGTLFISAFVLALWGSHRAGDFAAETLGTEISRLRPYMIAIVGSSVVGMFSSTRSYNIPTYTILGIAVSYLSLVEFRTGCAASSLSWQLIKRGVGLGMASLVFIYVYTRVFAVWE